MIPLTNFLPRNSSQIFSDPARVRLQFRLAIYPVLIFSNAACIVLLLRSFDGTAIYGVPSTKPANSSGKLAGAFKAAYRKKRAPNGTSFAGSKTLVIRFETEIHRFEEDIGIELADRTPPAGTAWSYPKGDSGWPSSPRTPDPLVTSSFNRRV